LLWNRREPGAVQQVGVGGKGFAAPFAKGLFPGVEGRFAHERARRLVGAVGEEASVEASAGHDVRFGVVVVGQQFVVLVHQLGHAVSLADQVASGLIGVPNRWVGGYSGAPTRT
jgi:hypothetical protein